MVICAKVAEPIEMSFGLWAWMGPRNYVLGEGPDPPMDRGNVGERGVHCKVETFGRELSKQPETIDLPFGLWTLSGPKEARVQSYSPGGANVPSWKGTLVPPGEYD